MIEDGDWHHSIILRGKTFAVAKVREKAASTLIVFFLFAACQSELIRRSLSKVCQSATVLTCNQMQSRRRRVLYQYVYVPRRLRATCLRVSFASIWACLRASVTQLSPAVSHWYQAHVVQVLFYCLPPVQSTCDHPSSSGFLSTGLTLFTHSSFQPVATVVWRAASRAHSRGGYIHFYDHIFLGSWMSSFSLNDESMWKMWCDMHVYHWQ